MEKKDDRHRLFWNIGIKIGKIALVVLAGNWQRAPHQIGSVRRDVKMYTLAIFNVNNIINIRKSHNKFQISVLRGYKRLGAR